ncbi:hypothetical protein [Pseudactinotalea sp. HY158]|uniref:hypothetical protein n=1 Tax=Pseudactinotalea sp. HY158 TaxID=2654547 RepID=UPI00129CC610|nr:hypothetical protein [Pseudactinotalea sp. HY158]QGH69027.1 hypothetical protein GCE65_05565 [Pseudactinotalea sp. HY158]
MTGGLDSAGDLDEALRAFAFVEPVSEHTRLTLGPHLPASVRDLWDRGVGYLGDGYWRTVDPVHIAAAVSQLADPIHASYSFPVLTSAFGDVLTCWHSRLYLINSRFGRYCGLGRADHLGAAIADLTGPDREFLTGPAPWAQAATELGIPGPYECFAYVPPLAARPLGNPEAPANPDNPADPTNPANPELSDLTGLVRTGLAAHLRFLAEFSGRVQGRF